MGIVQKYRVYKRWLQVLLVINFFLIAAGAVALVHYFQTQQIAALDLAWVGLATLIFGVVIPYLLFSNLAKAAQEMRRQTEETLAQWVSQWLETYRRHDDEPLKDPFFWINIALMSVEVFGEESKHPLVKMAAEFAPMIKKELQHPAKKKPKGKKNTALTNF